MSSYLVALCVGDFEQVEDQVKDVQVRMVTTRGKAQQGRYALGILRQLLPYYEDYTGVAYPLPKLDLIALPGGGGGMENWGAVIALESNLLFDPARAGQITRERIFAMVAHEVAHQWFGNLVTMAWWDDLWLNEGLTCWISDKAMEHFNPSWQYSQLRALSYREEALAADADRATHPVLQPVRNYAEASSAYDAITYFKGRGIIAMLEDDLGGETFCRGIRAYVKSHCYSSVTTADLWRALSRASGQDVDRVAGPWVHQEGFPLVRVGPAPGEGRELRQERFTLASPSPSTDTVQWPVPILWRCLDGVQDSTTITLLTAPPDHCRMCGPAQAQLGQQGVLSCSV
jgi:aminopeptidase N